MDFDNDEEFLEFFGGYRGEVMVLVRLVASVAPNMTLQFLCAGLTEVIGQAFQVHAFVASAFLDLGFKICLQSFAG